MEREATLRRVALEGYAKAVEAFLGADPSSKRAASQKRAASPKQSGEPGIMGPQTVRPPTAGNPTPKSPRERTDLRIYARAEPGTLLVRDQPFLIREAITKAVPQISAKDIPRLWATPTGWAVKPNTKAVYDLILKGSNAALICKATRCTILERVEKWHTYRLAHTPNVLTGLLGNRLVTADVVTEEAEIQTGLQRGSPLLYPFWVLRTLQALGEEKEHRTAQPRVPRVLQPSNLPRSPQMQQLRRCYIETPGASGAACTASPKCTGCHGPFPAGHKHCAATPKRADGKIVRLTASQLGEIRRQQTATRKACELAAKSQQERGPKSGVQVVIPTPGARIAAYEAADQQSRRVKRKTAPTGSLNLVELSKRSVYAVSDDEASPTLSQRRNGDDRDIVWLEVNGFHTVNVYREPSTRRIIDYITSIQVPPNFLIGGDFNAKHDMFEPGVGSSNQGASLAAWSLSSGADFIGEPGEPTHRAGHTIDLNLLEHPGEARGADGNAGYRVTEANLPTFAHAINSGISHLPQPADVLDTRDLDDIAALLTTLFQNAIKGSREAPTGRAAPEQERKRRDMLSTIRNAKRDYWRRVIDSAADDADLYKVVGWHKLAPSLKAPPLIVNGVSIESTKEKSEALLEKVLHRYDDSDDLEYDPLEAEGRRPILPWTTAISLEEVKRV
ncbi:hypothetical protein DID88_003538 [Monilinia fructigena]|uniref:Endonuclease/exonuclease/phosphatase domain-containing protein n=1 Tax=Monilinia fructigena TaxID=38457 RepID=A0A395IGS6_9HELO|nr:hypothetical protein DID88_003538 [Monilinia fructigena]